MPFHGWTLEQFGTKKGKRGFAEIRKAKKKQKKQGRSLKTARMLVYKRTPSQGEGGTRPSRLIGYIIDGVLRTRR